MPLSATNAVQAKTGHLDGDPAVVALDNPTLEGSTVTVEISQNAVIGIMDAGMPGHIPAGFEYDGCSLINGISYLHIFRKAPVTGGEQSWNFSIGFQAPWTWRVTEWDTALELVSPLEAISSGWAQGTSPTSLSTGNAPPTGTTDRSDLVCLVFFYWTRPAATAQSFDWSGHTNGFVERDELRWSTTGIEIDACWTWLFPSAAGQFETTATINLTTRSTQDGYAALLVVYAAAQPDIVAGPTVMSG